jgi:GNAT superfamily N-acetyltransferase
VARERRPPEQQDEFPPEVAAFFAAAAAGGGGAAAPAAGGLAATALTAAQVRQAAAAIIGALVRFGATRSGDDYDFLLVVLQQRYPDRLRADLERIAADELRREREFLRKQRERVERDIPEALRDTDPNRRLERVRRILEREKRYLTMRREAMTERAVVSAEMEYVRDRSPEGAYWKLSPYVREHTLDCLAMGEKFWPWNVLTLVHPQLHPGCRCQLLTKQEAVGLDLMDPDQVPEPKDAARLAKKLLSDARRLMEEGVTTEEIDAVIDARQAELEEAAATRGARIAASGARYYGTKAFERFSKGLEKGGEFKPRRGGFSKPTGARFTHLRGLVDMKTPKAKRLDRDGRWANLDGKLVKVPEARPFDREIAGRRFTSPAGSTNVYRDGKPYDGLDTGRLRPAEASAGPHTDRNGRPLIPGATVAWGGDEGFGAPDNKKGWLVSASPGLFEDDAPRMNLIFKDEKGDYRRDSRAPGDLRLIGDSNAATNLPRLMKVQAELDHNAKERDRRRLEDDPTAGFEEPDATVKEEWNATFDVDAAEGMKARLAMLGMTKAEALAQLKDSPGYGWLWRGRQRLPEEDRQLVIDRLADMLRAQHEEGPSQRALRAVGELDAGTSPVDMGQQGEAAHRALQKAGFYETGVTERPDTIALDYLHPDTGSTLTMEVDKASGQVVDHEWEPRAVQLPEAKKLEGTPGTWEAFAADIAWLVNDLGSRHDADTLLTSVRYRPDKFPDHAGEHTWAGEIELGADVAPALDALRAARNQDRPLTPLEARAVYGTYKVSYHEALHGVNPIPVEQYRDPVLSSLEEALTEEYATSAAHAALHRHGSGDVVRWAAANPHDGKVSGTYMHDRVRFDTILDRAGVSAERRPDVIEELKFRVDPAERPRRLGEMVAEAERQRGGRLTDAEDARDWVAAQMTAYPEAADFQPLILPQGEGGEAALLAPSITHLGADLTTGTRVTVRQGSTLKEGELVALTDAVDRGYAFTAGVRFDDGTARGSVQPQEIVDVGGPPSGSPKRLYVRGEDGKDRTIEAATGDLIRYDGRADGGTSEARIERILRTDNPASDLGRRGWALQAVTTQDSERPGTRIVLTQDRAGWVERADGRVLEVKRREGERRDGFQREEPPVTTGTGRAQPPLGERVVPGQLHAGERFLDSIGEVWEVRSVNPKRRGRTQLELSHADGPFAGMPAGRVTYGPDERPWWYRYDERAAAAHAVAQERAWRAFGGGRSRPADAPNPGRPPRPNLWHGTTRGAIPGGGFAGPEVYLAHDRELAAAYADTEGADVHEVQDLAEKPLVLDTPAKFAAAWEESGAGDVAGPFHPTQTHAFAEWARGKGYDAVDIPASAFEQDTGDAEADYRAYRDGPAGYFGEPQTIILDPKKARIVAGHGPSSPQIDWDGVTSGEPNPAFGDANPHGSVSQSSLAPGRAEAFAAALNERDPHLLPGMQVRLPTEAEIEGYRRGDRLKAAVRLHPSAYGAEGTLVSFDKEWATVRTSEGRLRVPRGALLVVPDERAIPRITSAEYAEALKSVGLEPGAAGVPATADEAAVSAMRMWRGDFAWSSNIRAYLEGREMAPAFKDDKRMKLWAEVLRRAADHGPPMGQETWRIVPGGGRSPGETVRFDAAAVAMERAEAENYRRTFVGGAGERATLYRIPAEAQGIAFPDGKEAVVRGDFVIDRVDKEGELDIVTLRPARTGKANPAQPESFPEEADWPAVTAEDRAAGYEAGGLEVLPLIRSVKRDIPGVEDFEVEIVEGPPPDEAGPRGTGPTGSGRYLFLFNLRVSDDERGQGAGSAALRRALEFADRRGLTTRLSPEPDEEDRFDQLVAWYGRFGFREGAGGWEGYLERAPGAGPSGKASPAPEPRGQLAGGAPPPTPPEIGSVDGNDLHTAFHDLISRRVDRIRKDGKLEWRYRKGNKRGAGPVAPWSDLVDSEFGSDIVAFRNAANDYIRGVGLPGDKPTKPAPTADKTWAQIKQKYPVYAEQHFEHAINEFNDDRTGAMTTPNLRFTEETVDLRDVRFQRFPEDDKRIAALRDGYAKSADIPPVMLVERNGELFTVDGHHRLSEQEARGQFQVRAIIAHATLDTPYTGKVAIGTVAGRPNELKARREALKAAKAGQPGKASPSTGDANPLSKRPLSELRAMEREAEQEWDRAADSDSYVDEEGDDIPGAAEREAVWQDRLAAVRAELKARGQAPQGFSAVPFVPTGKASPATGLSRADRVQRVAGRLDAGMAIGQDDPDFELVGEAIAARKKANPTPAQLHQRAQGILAAGGRIMQDDPLAPYAFGPTGKAQPAFGFGGGGGGTGIGGGKLKGLFGAWSGTKGAPLLFDDDAELDPTTPTVPKKKGPPPPPKTDDSGKLTHVKGAGGSNGAQWYEDAEGQRWLVKTYRGNVDRVATEVAANAIYRELGARAPEAGVIGVGGKPALGYKALEGEPRRHVFREEGPNADFSKHFMADALLANWDFVGLDDDNVLWDAEGKPIRVDQGGTLEFRAMGSTKPFGPVPTEVWTMVGPKGQGFRSVSLTEGEKKEQAAAIAAKLTPERIDAILDAQPWQDADMRERVRAALKARVGWMDRFAKGKEQLPKPAEGDEARAALSTRQEGLDLYPEQDLAVRAFGAGWADAVNGHLRAGAKKGESGGEVDFVIGELDSLLRFARTDEDVTIYAATDADLEPGDNLADKGYLGAALDAGAAGPDAGPVLLRITLPAGSSAFYTGDLEERPAGMPDVIVRRGQKYRVVGSTTVNGRVVVDLVAI